MVAALTSDTPAGPDAGAALRPVRDPLTDDDLRRAATLVEAAGGRTWSQGEADELVAHALAELESVDPAGAELAALARLVTHRDR